MQFADAGGLAVQKYLTIAKAHSTAQSTKVERYTTPSSCTVPLHLSVERPWLREGSFGGELEPVVIYPDHPVIKVPCTW